MSVSMTTKDRNVQILAEKNFFLIFRSPKSSWQLETLGIK